MQVINTKEGPMTIAGVYVIPPQSMRTFDDALWAELKQRKAVAFWLERGDLKEVAADSGAEAFELATIAAPEEASTSKRKKGAGTGGAAG